MNARSHLCITSLPSSLLLSLGLLLPFLRFART